MQTPWLTNTAHPRTITTILVFFLFTRLKDSVRRPRNESSELYSTCNEYRVIKTIRKLEYFSVFASQVARDSFVFAQKTPDYLIVWFSSLSISERLIVTRITTLWGVILLHVSERVRLRYRVVHLKAEVNHLRQCQRLPVCVKYWANTVPWAWCQTLWALTCKRIAHRNWLLK